MGKIQNISDILSETMEVRTMKVSRHWKIINILKEKKTAKILYHAIISFKNTLKRTKMAA